jgi:exopolysaccharide biosynthesis protein
MSSLIRLVCFLALCMDPVRADAPATQPAGREPVQIAAQRQADPPTRYWVVQIDLTDPRVKLKVVPGGADPDGDGPWQTTLLPVSRIAQENGLELAVNASFFAVEKTGPWEGKGYTVGQPASAVGRTVSDGRTWSEKPMSPDWPALWIDPSGRARITDGSQIATGATQVVAGNVWLLDDGKGDRTPETGMIAVRHPRTAVGVNRDGTLLTILIVDGRRPISSVGMTGAEMRAVLEKYDVYDAINLDGGGSTTLVHKNEQGELQIVNSPSGGSERPVANVLGVDVSE